MKNLYNDDVTAMKQVEGGKERRSTIVPIVNAIDDVIDNVNDDLTIAELCGLNIVLISLYFQIARIILVWWQRFG